MKRQPTARDLHYKIKVGNETFLIAGQGTKKEMTKRKAELSKKGFKVRMKEYKRKTGKGTYYQVFSNQK